LLHTDQSALLGSDLSAMPNGDALLAVTGFDPEGDGLDILVALDADLGFVSYSLPTCVVAGGFTGNLVISATNAIDLTAGNFDADAGQELAVLYAGSPQSLIIYDWPSAQVLYAWSNLSDVLSVAALNWDGAGADEIALLQTNMLSIYNAAGTSLLASDATLGAAVQVAAGRFSAAQTGDILAVAKAESGVTNIYLYTPPSALNTPGLLLAQPYANLSTPTHDLGAVQTSADLDVLSLVNLSAQESALPCQGQAAPIATSTPTPLPSQTPTPLPTEIPAQTIEAEDGAFVMQAGAWFVYNSVVASGGQYLYTGGNTQDTLTLNFEGDSLTVVYVQHPALGSFALEVDGIVRQTVNSTGDEGLGLEATVTGLGAGAHTLRVLPVSGVIAIDAFRVASAISPTPPAPEAAPPGFATLGDLIWVDNDADGQKDSGELGLAGVTVSVYRAVGDIFVASDVTDSNGEYSVTVPTGTGTNFIYYLQITVPSGYTLTRPNATGNDFDDSDFNPLTGRTSNFSPADGSDNPQFGDGGLVQLYACPTTTTAEIALVINSAGTVGSDDYDLARYFMLGLTRTFTLGSSLVRISLVQYGDQGLGQTVTTLASNASATQLQTALAGMSPRGGNRDLQEGINLAQAQLNAGRLATQVPRIMVLLTDAEQSATGDPVLEATTAKNAKTSIFVLAFGGGVNTTRANSIASDPDSRYVVTEPNFSNILSLLNSIGQDICDTPIAPIAAPALSAPATAALVNTNTPTFSWQAVNFTEARFGGYYQIQVDDSATFASPEISEHLGTGILTYTPPSSIGVDRAYNWRVRAWNNAGPGPWSMARTFTIDTVAPTVPTLTSPADNSFQAKLRPSFTWAPSLGANRYVIQVDDQDDFSSPIVNQTVTTTTFTMTTGLLKQGTYYWRVQALDAAGNTSAYTAYRTFKVNLQTSPVDLSVVYNSAGTRPTFAWAIATGLATQYQLEVDDDSTFASPVYTSPILTMGSHTIPNTSPVLSPDVYYWRVKVNYGTGLEASPLYFTLNIFPNQPAIPVLVAPANASSTNDETPNLSWSAVTYPIGTVEYTVQLSQSATFATIAHTLSNLTSTNVDAPALADGTWYWRVRTDIIDANFPGLSSAFSTGRSFTVDDTPPAPPNLNSPANGAIITSARPTFSWTAPASATSYRVRIDNSADCLSPEIETTLSTTSFIPTTSLKQGVYYWCVYARDSLLNESGISAIRTFTLNIQTTPANNTTTFNGNPPRPTFAWALVTGATQYQLEIDDATDFASPVYTSTPLSATSSSHAIPLASPALNFGVYYWRVKVNYGTGLEASPLYFTLNIFPTQPVAPTLTNPAIGALFNNNPTTPNLQWNAVTSSHGTVTYTLQLSQSATFATISQEISSINATSYNVGALGNGTWYWRVRTDVGNASYPNFQSIFSTARSFVVDTIPPNTPSLTAPAANAVLTTARPTFTWGLVMGATGYRLIVAVDSACNVPVSGLGIPANLTTGSYTLTVTLIQGTYYWCVAARDAAGNFSSNATRSFNVSHQTMPANNTRLTNNQLPSFSWTSATGALGYELEISTNDSFSSIAFEQTFGPTTLTYKLTSPLAFGTYYWRVNVNYGSLLPSPFFHKLDLYPNAPSTPILTGPPTGFITNNPIPPNTNEVLLTWNPATFASGSPKYTVQFARNSTFTTGLETFDADTFNNIFLPQTLTDGLWYWRVRAEADPLVFPGLVGAYSISRSLTIDKVPPPVTIPTLPNDEAISTNLRPSFSWGVVAGAKTYQFQIVPESIGYPANPEGPYDPATITINNILTTSYAMTTNLAQGRYLWRVRAIDAAGNKGVWSFERVIVINIQLTPANNSQITNAPRPTFSWASVPGAAAVNPYQLQVATDDTFNTIILTYTAPTTAITRYTVPTTDPALPFGTLYWRVNLNTGSGFVNSPLYFAFRNYPSAPPAPTLLNPATGFLSNNPTINVSWSAVAPGPYGAITYRVEFSPSATFAMGIIPETGLSTTNVNAPSLSNGVWYWRVRAESSDYPGLNGAFSMARSFTIDTLPPGGFTLTAPALGAITTAVRPVFSWASAAGANRYFIQVDDNDDFSSPIFDNIQTTTTSYTPTTNLPQGLYYWRVKARDAANNEGPYTASRSFYVNIQTSPANNTILRNTPRPNFMWASGGIGATYQLQVATDNLFANVVYTFPNSGTTTLTSNTPTTNLPFGTLYWRVNLNGVTSPVFFTLNNYPAAPSTPTLVSPNNSALLNTDLPNLSWNAVTYANGPVRYDVQYSQNSLFTTGVVTIQDVTATNVNVSAPLANGLWYWRVLTEAVDYPGLLSNYSIARTFTVDTIPPSNFNLTAPANGSTASSARPTFSWGAAGGATRYVLQVDDDGDFSSGLIYTSASLTTTSHIPPSNLSSGVRHWRVTAYDAANNERVSATFTVTIP
jgi:hypothetical protein